MAGYLKEIQGGKKWDDVATEANSGAANAGGSVGDLGLTTQANLGVEPDLATAIFSLAKVNDITPTIKGTDGVLRMATVSEIAPAYTEQNDPLEQRERLEHQAGGEQQKLDEDFLVALEHGMPPAGGIGIGIDRLCMMLLGQESIRDVILFPQLKPK